MDNESAIELAGTDTVRVVDVPPVVVVEVLVETDTPPLLITLVIPLIAGGGVVVEPATVVPLGWPEELPPAIAIGIGPPVRATART